ncbi:MAG: hypothetical protein CL844_06885 [Crocinitomicaceae bacterium]|nr:hypothetical protein [Crocinitomicaceae bacterium]|tara:strand:+ start:30297 stop:31856 length:1560 start_codon:yes stop_codon:yes gene_type:complete
MSQKNCFIFFGIFLFFSCAQVGRISGGEVDVFAPKPIEEKTTPKFLSTNFNVSRVEICFDEFFRLKNTGENIVMVPPHANIKTSYKGKKLFLDWNDSLDPNTTYSIYLNNAIVDLTEGNDSIIQYVFSTGDYIDSLSYSTRVVDAWSKKPVKNATVLLSNKESDKLKSFAYTDEDGFAEINFLKPDEYKISVFKDLNGDLERQKNEPLAFTQDDIFFLKKTKLDTVPYRLYTPIEEPRITTKKLIGPNSFFISGNRSLKNTEIKINNETILLKNIIYHKEDSVEVFWNTRNKTKAEISLNGPFFKDTFLLRFSEKTTKAKFALKEQNNSFVFYPSDTVCFNTNDIIESFDTSKILVLNPSDSSLFKAFDVSKNKNKISFYMEKAPSSKLKFIFQKGAVCSFNDSVDSCGFSVILKSLEELGSISLNLSYYKKPVIFQLRKNGRLYKEKFILEPKKPIVMKEIPPGEYSFAIIKDENKNGLWDVGNLKEKKQPESVDFYTKTAKVRAGWEVSVELIPNEE